MLFLWYELQIRSSYATYSQRDTRAERSRKRGASRQPEWELTKAHAPAVTKGCLMEVRGAHYPLTWGLKTTPL